MNIKTNFVKLLIGAACLAGSFQSWAYSDLHINNQTGQDIPAYKLVDEAGQKVATGASLSAGQSQKVRLSHDGTYTLYLQTSE